MPAGQRAATDIKKKQNPNQEFEIKKIICKRYTTLSSTISIIYLLFIEPQLKDNLLG